MNPSQRLTSEKGVHPMTQYNDYINGGLFCIFQTCHTKCEGLPIHFEYVSQNIPFRGRPLLIWGWGRRKSIKRSFRRPFSRIKKILRFLAKEFVFIRMGFPGKNKFIWKIFSAPPPQIYNVRPLSMSMVMILLIHRFNIELT